MKGKTKGENGKTKGENERRKQGKQDAKTKGKNEVRKRNAFCSLSAFRILFSLFVFAFCFPDVLLG